MYKIQPKTLFVGKNIVYLPSCHSTNDFASELIQNQQVFEGTIVITSDQTAGRGQRGNSWESQANQNITLSLVLKPSFLAAQKQFKLNIAISLGIHHFLNAFGLENLRIKWPNDIYVGDKKMGGVLIENSLAGSRISHSIIGIGLNINQSVFSNPSATSLKIATQNQENFNLETLVERLSESIEKYYLQLKTLDFQKQHAAYLDILFRFNQSHYFKKNDELFLGKIVDVSEQGLLIMEVNNNLQAFDLKEISYII